MKKTILLSLLCALLSAAFTPAAWADGSMDLIVATRGAGAPAYAASTASKAVGVLYNGFRAWTSPDSKNGRHKFYFTEDFSYYIDADRAMSLLPDEYWSTSPKDLQAASLVVPCNVFAAKINAPGTPLYLAPEGGVAADTYDGGALTLVCGEFGGRYLVDGYGITGFIDKNALTKVQDLNFWALSDIYSGLARNQYEAKTVYTDGGSLYAGTAHLLQNGDTVYVLTYTQSGLAQLDSGGFIESRYLDANGDHTTRRVYAAVKTDHPLNRLRVNDGKYTEKLCSGVQVEVLRQRDGMALIFLGDPRGEHIFGHVKTEFLAFGEDAESVPDGTTAIRLTKGASGLPQGTALRVIGCHTGYEAGDPDRLIARTEDGKLTSLFNAAGNMEIVRGQTYVLRTADSVKMRQEPNKEGKVLRTLGQGVKIDVLFRGESWTLVQYKNRTGWVMSRFIKFP